MNKAIIFSGPSASGKTTIVKHLFQHNPVLQFSVSACTRAKRPHETAGKDYYFLSEAEFKKKITQHKFIEREEVYPGHYYGTLKAEVERLWRNGKVIVFDVDVKGALQLKNYFQNQSLAVYIKVPIALLKARLIQRNTEHVQSMAQRMARVKYENSFANQFDVVVLNKDLTPALQKAQQLVTNFLVPG